MSTCSQGVTQIVDGEPPAADRSYAETLMAYFKAGKGPCDSTVSQRRTNLDDLEELLFEVWNGGYGADGKITIYTRGVVKPRTEWLQRLSGLIVKAIIGRAPGSPEIKKWTTLGISLDAWTAYFIGGIVGPLKAFANKGFKEQGLTSCLCNASLRKHFWLTL